VNEITHASPTLAGPIPVTAGTGEPFGGVGSPVGLAEPPASELLPAHDFIEEEYVLSGAVDGEPYTTTLLVRRPRDAKRFSGLVVLEPVHIQGALGLWQTGHSAMLEGGHAWVAIGSQRGAVEGPIRMSNPSRYARLQVPPGKAGPGGGLEGALGQWSQSNSASLPPELFSIDHVSNEIMTQAGAMLKSNSSNGPLAGLLVEYLLMGGASQTGMHTLNYIKARHGAARLADGRPIYDGYLPMAAPSLQPVAGGDAAVVHIFAEGDLALFGAIGPQGHPGARRDGDAPNDRYRSYQIAGSSHLPTRGLREATAIPALGVALESGERFTQFPSGPFYQGALVNLVNWLTKGMSPPTAPPIEILDGKIVQDEFGNASGGLRSPYVDLPTARYIAARYLRNLIGVEIAFPQARLQSLYRSPAAYLQRFDRGIDELIERRWISAADGKRLKTEEAEAPPF